MILGIPDGVGVGTVLGTEADGMPEVGTAVDGMAAITITTITIHDLTIVEPDVREVHTMVQDILPTDVTILEEEAVP